VVTRQRWPVKKISRNRTPDGCRETVREYDAGFVRPTAGGKAMSRSLRNVFVPVLTIATLVLVAGCTTTRATGGIHVLWATSPNTCGGLGIADVKTEIVSANTNTLYATDLQPCESYGSNVVTVVVGSYKVRVVGIAVGGAVVSQSEYVPVTVMQGVIEQVNALSLVPGGSGVNPNKGTFTVSWTVNGEAPATGCSKYGLAKVAVSLNPAGGGSAIGAAPIDCTKATTTLGDIAPGFYTLQIDAQFTDGTVIWGNELATKPDVTITAGTETKFGNPVPLLDLRGAVDVTWSFMGNQSCAQAGVSKIGFVVMDGGTVLVDYLKHADAKKPCDLSGATLATRLLDITSPTSTCMVPQTFGGVLVCGLTAGKSTYTIDVYGLDAQGFALNKGHAAIQPLKEHTLATWQAALSPCDAKTNPCN